VEKEAEKMGFKKKGKKKKVRLRWKRMKKI
jgi:hypothetical protein